VVDFPFAAADGMHYTCLAFHNGFPTPRRLQHDIVHCAFCDTTSGDDVGHYLVCRQFMDPCFHRCPVVPRHDIFANVLFLLPLLFAKRVAYAIALGCLLFGRTRQVQDRTPASHLLEGRHREVRRRRPRIGALISIDSPAI